MHTHKCFGIPYTDQINCRQTNVRTYRVVFYGCHHVGCSHMLSSYTAAKQSQTSGATANVQATNDHDANLPILSRARACVGFLREGENGECRHYILKFASRCADNYALTDRSVTDAARYQQKHWLKE